MKIFMLAKRECGKCFGTKFPNENGNEEKMVYRMLNGIRHLKIQDYYYSGPTKPRINIITP